MYGDYYNLLTFFCDMSYKRNDPYTVEVIIPYGLCLGCIPAEPRMQV